MKRVPARSAQPEAAGAIAAAAAAAIGIGGKATRITPRRPLRLAGVDFGLPRNAGELGLQLQTELSWVSSLLLIRTHCAAVIRSGGAREIGPVLARLSRLQDSVITAADILESSVAEQVHALQQAAYLVESQRIGSADFPPLRESIQTLQQSTDRFLVFVEAGRIVGALSFEIAGNCVTVTRLVVSPDRFRRGIASALLTALEGRLAAASTLCATTGDLNKPAVSAYEKQGYRTVSRLVSPEGIALRRLQKRLVVAKLC